MDWETVKGVFVEIPGLPPTVNHYKVPVILRTREGPVKSMAMTPEAEAFRQTTAIVARGLTIIPADRRVRDKVAYGLIATVYFGKGDRGDGDNFWKSLADAIAHAGVIHSDAKVLRWVMDVEKTQRDDPRNPRTVIFAYILQPDEPLTEYIMNVRKSHAA